MNPKEFVCWLDGALTLNEGNELTSTQTSLLKNKLSKIEKSGTDKSAKVCSWLQGYFDMVEPVTLDAQVLTKIKEKVDLTLSGRDQVKEQSSHLNNGGNSDFTVRC